MERKCFPYVQMYLSEKPWETKLLDQIVCVCVYLCTYVCVYIYMFSYRYD